jgi:hypothetical protein
MVFIALESWGFPEGVVLVKYFLRKRVDSQVHQNFSLDILF